MLPRYEPREFEFAAPFWSAIADGRIALPRCSVCQRWQWYPEPHGTDCRGGTLEWRDVPQTGTLYSFSEVHRSFLPGGKEHVPYWVGMIDLDGLAQDGFAPRLVAPLSDAAGIEWKIGMRVVATFVQNGARPMVVFEPATANGPGSIQPTNAIE